MWAPCQHQVALFSHWTYLIILSIVSLYFLSDDIFNSLEDSSTIGCNVNARTIDNCIVCMLNLTFDSLVSGTHYNFELVIRLQFLYWNFTIIPNRDLQKYNVHIQCLIKLVRVFSFCNESLSLASEITYLNSHLL